MAEDWRLAVIDAVTQGGYWKSDVLFESRAEARKELDKVTDKARALGTPLRTKVVEIRGKFIGYLWEEGKI